jgi:hypothetical protein
VRSDRHHLVEVTDLASERVAYGFLSDKVLVAATVSGEVVGPKGMSPELRRMIVVRKSTKDKSTFDVELIPDVRLRRDSRYDGAAVAFGKRVEMHVPFVTGVTRVRFLCGGKESRVEASFFEKIGPLLTPRR